MVRHFILGTAGHIDHGKSTLVRTLTGIDPDRLPEEKARGMTIELGFAHLDIKDPEIEGTTYQLGIVDVPGHSDFVRNMVAGVTGIDVALFIVAADDSWMPQSEEHVQVLSYLGIQHAVVALTKADLAEDLAFSQEMLREELKGTILEKAPIIPVSALTGKGLDELKAALAEVLRAHPGPLENGKPRLHVDRAFSPTGVGTVVTGTLTGGALAGGTEAVVQPLALPTTIRVVQSHKSKKDHAKPGMRTALNLSDIAIATREKREGVERGDVITTLRCGGASLVMDVRVEKAERAITGQPGFTRPIRAGAKVRVHHGSASHEARIYLLGTRSLEPGQSSLAELRFEAPVHAFAGDRFVLRDWSKRYTIGGGLILDPDARRPDFRKATQKEFLQAAEKAWLASPPSITDLLTAVLQRHHAVLRDGLLTKSRFSEAEIRKGAEALVKAQAALSDGGWLIASEWWKAELAFAAQKIRQHHEAHPESQGLALTEIRRFVEPRLPDKRLLELILTHLTKEGFARSAETIRQGTHQATLPPALAEAGAKLRILLEGNVDPPNPAELAPTPTDQKALRFLIQQKEAIELSDKAVIAKTVYDQLKQVTISLCQSKGQATASEIREATGTTRRILIPFLERLDKEGVTRRQGDFRALK